MCVRVGGRGIHVGRVDGFGWVAICAELNQSTRQPISLLTPLGFSARKRRCGQHTHTAEDKIIETEVKSLPWNTEVNYLEIIYRNMIDDI